MGCLYAQRSPVLDVTTDYCHTEKMNLHFHPKNAIVPAIEIPKRNTNIWLSTNVVYHPWNKLTLNGKPVQSKPYQWFYAVNIPKSGGILSYSLTLEPFYLMLDHISFTLFITLLIVLVYRLFLRNTEYFKHAKYELQNKLQAG